MYARLIGILLSVAISGSFILSTEGKSTPKIVPKDYPIIIGCINQFTGEIKKPLSQEYWACYHGSKGWKNLRFPSKEQLKLMKEVYKNRAGMVTAMTLMNHESQFNKDAKGCHKGGCDYSLFQIRDVNGGKTMTQKQQMQWFATRKASQIKAGGNCSQHVKSGQERLLRCIFARHRGDTDGFAKYPSDRLKEWRFYNSLTF